MDRRMKIADRLMTTAVAILLGGLTLGGAAMAATALWAGEWPHALLPGLFALVFALMAAAFVVGTR